MRIAYCEICCAEWEAEDEVADRAAGYQEVIGIDDEDGAPVLFLRLAPIVRCPACDLMAERCAAAVRVSPEGTETS